MKCAEVITFLRQFNERCRDCQFEDKYRVMEAIDAAVDKIERLEAAESSVAWHQRRWMALQMNQKKMREPERTIVCDILANGKLMHPTVAGNRYSVKEESK